MMLNVGVQHQIGASVSLSANYYRRDYQRIIWTENLAAPVAGWNNEYTPVTIPDPRANGQSITIYNVNSAYAGLVNELDKNSKNNSRTYNGFDFTFNARLERRDTARRHLNREASRGHVRRRRSNQLRGCDAEQPFPLSSSSPAPTAPGAFRLSAVFQSMPGVLETRTANNDGDVVMNYIVNRTVIPTLTLAQVTTRLNDPGTNFLDRNNQLDLSVTRNFKFGRFMLKRSWICSMCSMWRR